MTEIHNHLAAEPKADVVPPSIEEMKQAIKDSHERLVRELGEKRAAREKLNLEIAQLVTQAKEAERLVKALEPRKAKK